MGSKRCYPDPDDMPLWDVEKNKSTNWAIDNMVRIDENDNIIKTITPGTRNISVWDISHPSAETPKIGDLSYDNYPYGFDFKLDQTCDIFPSHILLELGVRAGS